jgi:hypothetical protein
VVATEACPRGACTRLIGACRSSACEAWAWRNQWALTAFGNPARAAARFTRRWIADSRSGPPLLLDRNTGPAWHQTDAGGRRWALNETELLDLPEASPFTVEQALGDPLTDA